MESIKLGMIGTGRIAQRFVSEARCCLSEEEQANIIVYNPNEESAMLFAKRYNLRYADNLLDFINQVDAVYIATPHETHYEYAKEMLQNGKHVLCEKPMVLKEEQARELFAIAKETNVVLMEAIKTAYCPGFLGLRELIADGTIGRIVDVEACFSKLGDGAGRELWSEAGGSFTELGSYCMLPIAKLLGHEMQLVHQWSLAAITGNDSYSKVVFESEMRVATTKTGLGVKSDGELMIAGELGYIHVPSPWWLTKKIEVRHENPNQVEVYEFPFEGAGLRYEIRAFLDVIKEHKEEKCLSAEDSIWLASQMEQFLHNRPRKELGTDFAESKKINIWAHRGCSFEYPENTLLSFEKAAMIEGITGIELDVQLTKDGEIVVIHDETLNRTSTGIGYVKDMTIHQIKELDITPSGQSEIYIYEGQSCKIPTLREVFTCLKPYCDNKGLLINIELKNSIVRYEGMEEKVLALIDEMQMEKYIIFSSFLAESMGVIKKLDSTMPTGILAGSFIDALDGMEKYTADAIHPCITGLPINPSKVQELKEENMIIRVWNSQEPLFGQKKKIGPCDLDKYSRLGMTDLFTNVPDRYL